MKQILFLLDYYAPHRGGIENVFENIISRLRKKDYHIILLTSRFDPQLPTQEHQKNLTIYRVGSGRKSFFFAAFWKGALLLKKYPHISILHASTYTSALPASILASIFRKKSILTVHEIFGKLRKFFKPRYSRRMYQRFEKLSFMGTYHLYHCVSLYTLNSLRIHYGLPDHKLQLMYNGVEEDFWTMKHVSPQAMVQWKTTYGREGKYLMLYYGHSGVSKGIDYLLDAIPAIIQKNPDGMLIFNLIPAKRGPEILQRIQQQAKKSGHPEQVRIFNGREREALRELVACADVVIAPSLAEGFGSVHSEVCAMGKPLITTQMAAIPEVVSGKVIFIQARCSQAIVQGIEAARKEERTTITPKHFSREDTVEQLIQWYE